MTAARRVAAAGPLNIRIGNQRRFAVARTTLADYRAIREHHGGSINDAVLAVISGALRMWLLSRGEAVNSTSVIRAMVPLSVRDTSANHSAADSADKVSAHLLDLPVGEPNPVVRLHHISHAMRAHQESGHSVAAKALIRLSGFAPPTLHALGARAAHSFSRRIFNLVITNVPGPQELRYAAGAKMVEMFPVVPLTLHQALSIGVTSYSGGVYFGLNADRDALADVDVLAGMIEESVEELVGVKSL